MLTLILWTVIGFGVYAFIGLVSHWALKGSTPSPTRGWTRAPVFPYSYSTIPEVVLGTVYAQTGRWGTPRDLAAAVAFRDAEIAMLEAQLEQAQAAVPPVPFDEDPAVLPTKYEVQFKPEEPTSFAEFEGQQHIIRPLAAAVAALDPDQRVSTHVLFTGLPGRGKTLLAKVKTAELQRRAAALGLPPVAYFETFAANLTNVADLDATAKELLEAGGGVWFIDEIHVMPHDLSTKIFALMEDGKYPFHGSVTPTRFPAVEIIGATTDYGKLHPALKRRFGEPYMVRPMSPDELRRVIEQQAFAILPDAVELLLSRTHWSGAPWEAKVLFAQARTFAKARGRSAITVEDVHEVFDTFEIDKLGLRWIDREVVGKLLTRPRFRGKQQEFVCYGASESDVCAMAGLDPEEYRETIKPRLMARQLLEVKSGYGQALTAKAADLYGDLKGQ